MVECERLASHVMRQAERVIELQTELTAFRALGPENGGQGEGAKADFIEKTLGACLPVLRIDSPDSRVESGKRPNLVALIKGKSPKTLWLFGHMDVVPSGDPAQWKGDPWKIRREGDFIYGRGVEDNQQACVGMIILAESLARLDLIPELSLGLVFMADEECGSRHGLSWILSERPDLFSPDDFYIAPDGGSPDACAIEIAEKGQLWLKFNVFGKQCHASMPQAGINAFSASCRLVCALSELDMLFAQVNPLFLPPVSTFAPTMSKGGSEAINIISGHETFWMDCRVLPDAAIRDVKAAAASICERTARETGARMEFEVVQEHSATMTPETSPCVIALARAIKKVYGVTAQPVGIGGATVAAILRERGLPGVVWACLENTCHQPEERSSIQATLKDAAVFASIIMDPANA